MEQILSILVGESTRPNGEEITLEEELKRVIPIISRIRQETSIPISIDTTKAQVASSCHRSWCRYG